eukprot:1163636-Amphidinium_carterae.1
MSGLDVDVRHPRSLAASRVWTLVTVGGESAGPRGERDDVGHVLDAARSVVRWIAADEPLMALGHGRIVCLSTGLETVDSFSFTPGEHRLVSQSVRSPHKEIPVVV